MNFKKFAYRAEETDNGANLGGGESSAPTSTSTPAEDSSVNWENLDAEFDTEGEFEIPVNTAKAAEETSQPAQTEATKPAQAAEVQPQAEVKPEATVEPAKADATVETPADNSAFDWNKWEADTIANLTPQYQLTDEETASMLTEPELVLPKMAASVHARVIQNVLAQLPQILQQLVPQINQSVQKETDLKSKFFSVNDDLADAKYAKAISNAGRMFRSLNPNADVETASVQVGNMVRLSLGMPIRAAGQQNQQQQIPAQPAKTQPFIPAQGGSGGSVSTKPSNDFEAFAQELLDEE